MQTPGQGLGWSRWLLFLSALLACCCGHSAMDASAPETAPALEAAPAPPSAPDEGLEATTEQSASEEEPLLDSEKVELKVVAGTQGSPLRAPASGPPKSVTAAPPAPAPPPPPPQAGTPGTNAKGATPPPNAPLAQGPLLAATPGTEKKAPLLIYSANVTMAVFGTAQALNAVEELARSRNGYLVKRDDTSITIRVPAAAFQDALSGLKSLGDELHREVNARDVTEQYADLEVRLRNAEVVRQRLETLLAKASSVEDALAVERELGRVTQIIEQIKGKLKLLGELVAFSTITVVFQARAVESVRSEVTLPFDWLNQLGLSNLLSL